MPRPQLVYLWLFCMVGFASLASGEEKKAVTAVSKELGFKLTDVAATNLGVVTTKLTSAKDLTVKSASLVFVQDQVGLYRLREGWLRRISITIHSRPGDRYTIGSNELVKGDAIVIDGAPLLRVIEMDAFSD